MADSTAADLFHDLAFVEAVETLTRHVVGDIVDNANPRPSSTDVHTRLRELIARIVREELARGQQGQTPVPTGQSSDLDRAGAPVVPEPVPDLALRAPDPELPSEN